MKTIIDYTIYCTESQTKKALELGAPIQRCPMSIANLMPSVSIADGEYYANPSAEQMMGWLRSKGFRFKISEFKETTFWQVFNDGWFIYGDSPNVSPKEAILASIDAALEYLANNKK